MTQSDAIYTVGTSIEDDRPEIDFEAPENQLNDWLSVGNVLRGRSAVSEYRIVNVSVNANDASEWHFYSVSGTLGLFSREAIMCMGSSAVQLFQLLDAKLNGNDYYFLRPSDRLPCFDHEHAIVVPFPHDAKRIMKVEKYAFFKERIAAHCLFCIPEIYRLFGTDSVMRSIKTASLRGIEFERVA